MHQVIEYLLLGCLPLYVIATFGPSALFQANLIRPEGEIQNFRGLRTGRRFSCCRCQILEQVSVWELAWVPADHGESPSLQCEGSGHHCEFDWPMSSASSPPVGCTISFFGRKQECGLFPGRGRRRHEPTQAPQRSKSM